MTEIRERRATVSIDLEVKVFADVVETRDTVERLYPAQETRNVKIHLDETFANTDDVPATVERLRGLVVDAMSRNGGEA